MLTKELYEKAMSTDPAQVGHYIQGGFMHPRIKPVDEKFKVLGPAFTIRLPGTDNDMLYYAMKRAPKGSVVVIDRMGDDRYACCGEMVVRSAMSLELAGIVIDGPNTDTLPIKELGFPVFSTGRAAVTNTLKGIDGEFNVDICCGGAVVHPGDIIYGDCDGVIVVPADRFEELVNAACAHDREEVMYREVIRNGKTLCDLVNIEKAVETDTGALLSSIHTF